MWRSWSFSASVDDAIFEPTDDVNLRISVSSLDGRLVENDGINPVFLYEIVAQVFWWTVEYLALGQRIDFFRTGLLMPVQDARQVRATEESESHDSMLISRQYHSQSR